jgi:flagellar hook protein FlgE
MLRSMNSAISGLKVHQLFMDVIGNNIANVNTTGFKGSRTTFQSMLAQTLRGAQAPGNQRAGINPQQVGLGAIIAAVDVVQTQGALTTTSKTTDLAVQGDGMFVVTDGVKKYYTRDGAFDLGADSTLVSSATGMKVLGWSATADASGHVTINTGVPPTGPITIPTGQSATSRVSRTVGFNGNLNGAATERTGSGIVESTAIATAGTIGFPIATTDTITFTYNGQTVTTAGLAAATANSTNLATVATDIAAKMNAALVAAGVVAAGSTPITVTAVDTTGVAHEGTFSFQADKSLSFGNSASTNSQLNTALRNRHSSGLESVSTTMTVYDSLGASHEISVRFDKVNVDAANQPVVDTWKWTLVNLPPDTTIDGTGTNGQGHGYVKFDTGGRFQSVNTLNASNAVAKASQAGVRLNFANGAANGQDVTLDFSQLSQLQGDNTATAYSNDGFPTGTLVGFVIGPDGVVTGSFSNGISQAIGQIALATFANTGGLTQVGQSLYSESPNSGIATVGTPGSGNRGQINAGQLEMSNVDLASQFTDMIRAERGFQANSRIITTSDEMLQDLVNLKR